jgi:intracellular multiplication protein IcmD
MNITRSQLFSLCAIASMTMVSTLAHAAVNNLSAVISQVQGNIEPIANFLIIVSYIGGVAFALTGILQFKAHKDNPQQTPLSKPIIYIIVGALLLFLPVVLGTAGQSIFGGTDNSSSTGNINTIQ